MIINNGEAGGMHRIAIVSVHGCPLMTPGMRSAGGMNVYLRKLMPLIAERGVCVDIYTRSHEESGPRIVDLAPHVRVIHIQAGPEDIAKEDLPLHLADFQRGLLDYVRRQELGYDLIHSHYWLSAGPGRLLAAALRVPHVVTFHTLALVKESAHGEPESPERIQGEYEAATSADRVFVFTPDEAATVSGLYEVPRERIHVAPGGVDTAMFAPRPTNAARAKLGLSADDRVVLYVGRLEGFKGPHLIVEALPHLRDLHNTRLLLVGGAPNDREADRLLRLAADLGVADRVTRHAAVPQAELPEYYAASDTVVMPSLHETFGFVALEAMASGVPVVAASVGALRSLVVDGRTGLLVERHEPVAYAQALRRVLGDDSLRARMSVDAVRWAARFDWDQAAGRLHAGYAAVLAHAAERPPVTPCEARH
ncbi:MAG: glycosyltransferase [SAR202 cluster bacterium]|nr:glycosyltransferase [SAR202 cluster bacterium]